MWLISESNVRISEQTFVSQEVGGICYILATQSIVPGATSPSPGHLLETENPRPNPSSIESPGFFNPQVIYRHIQV